ncbi:MAG: outer membrane beta-barrel protein [Gammaproteobacteria bacterium]
MKKISNAISASLALLIGTQCACAAETEFQITPRVGFSSLKVGRFVGVNAEDKTTETLGIGAGFGVRIPLGIVLEIGADEFSDLDLFDELDGFTLKQRFVDVGYQFELGDAWRIVPRIGRAKWKLRSEEGRLFNPGLEASRNIRGNDNFFELSVSRRISKVVALGGSYRYGNYGFGRNGTTAFLVTVSF